MVEGLREKPLRAEEHSPSATALLDAAAAILSRRSVIEISLSDVAKESGLNSALVKYYFGGKEGMLLALHSRDAYRAVEEMEHLVQMNASPEAKMRIHISGMINTYYRSPYLNRLMHYLIGNGETEAGDKIARFFVAPILNAQRTILEQGMAIGQFRPVDPELFYFSLTGACDHIFFARHSLLHLHGEAQVTDELRQRYIKHVTEFYMTTLLTPLPT
jgi:AcrR family transcriptional regulator